MIVYCDNTYFVFFDLLAKVAISNFIIIDELEVSFEEGFSAITGETGTGKSIIIDAIEFCCGKNNVRIPRKYFEKETSVVLYFKNSEITEICRKVDSKNKSTFYIDGKPASRKNVRDLTQDLINIVSQFNSILDQSEYLQITDSFMLSKNPEIQENLNKIKNLFQQIQSNLSDISELGERLAKFKKEQEENLEIIKTLESIDIKENEETKLLEQRVSIQKANAMQNTITSVTETLKNVPIEQKLNQILRQLEKLDDASISELSSRIEKLLIEFSDITGELQNIQAETFSSQSKIEQIDDRISLLRELGRKYNISSGILFEFLNSARHKLQETDSTEVELRQRQEDLQKLKKEYESVAAKVSEARKQAAVQLSSKVCERLKNLNMKEAAFQISVCPVEGKLSESGQDEIEFLANFNQKSDLLPIAEIASGGEAARLNFAIKTVLAVYGKPQTIVFDEIDIGIGGAAAYLMGTAMRNLSDEKIQVIAITHSPQVAARATTHILVRKSIRNETISVSSSSLTPKERALEIARMISGTSVNSESIAAAKQLLE